MGGGRHGGRVGRLVVAIFSRLPGRAGGFLCFILTDNQLVISSPDYHVWRPSSPDYHADPPPGLVRCGTGGQDWGGTGAAKKSKKSPGGLDKPLGIWYSKIEGNHQPGQPGRREKNNENPYCIVHGEYR